MINKIKLLKKQLSLAEKDGKKIGLFRTNCAIFGGFFVSYLAMTTLSFFIPGEVGESIIIPILLKTLVWAIVALWISLAATKWIAFLRVLVPSFSFSFLLIFLYFL